MPSIYTIQAREILDARGVPTIECTVWLDNGMFATSAAPSGTSRGKYESATVKDSDSARLRGYGMLHAAENIRSVIGPQLVGRDPTKQTEIDQILVNLDGTPNKSHLGANTMIAVSQAVVKAAALSVGMPTYYYIQQKYQLTDQLFIPTCIYNMIDGGKHATTNLDFQEFQIIPASHIDYPTSLEMAATIFHKLGEI